MGGAPSPLFDVAQTSAAIMERLREEALGLGRPEERLATLDRLVEACDAVAGGNAGDIVKRAGNSSPALGRAFELYFKRGAPELNPNRIQEYVEARALLDVLNRSQQRIWTGPKAATLRNDKLGMLMYVRTRAMEQAQGGPVKRSRHRSVDEDVDLIADLSARQRVRFALENGHRAMRELTILKNGLKEIPAIDVKTILESAPPSVSTVPSPLGSVTLAASQPSDLTDAEKVKLAKLLTGLLDNTFLSNFDLIYDGNRVKSRSTSDPLIERSMLVLLKRVTGDRSAEA